MKKKVILLILLLNLVFSTSGIAQEELVTLRDTSISSAKVDVNKISTIAATQKIKNEETTPKNTENINSHEVIRTQITTNAVKNTETTINPIKNIQSNQEIKTTQNIKEEKKAVTPHENKKPITLNNVFEVNSFDLNELCGYCGFSGQECEIFKNYLISNYG